MIGLERRLELQGLVDTLADLLLRDLVSATHGLITSVRIRYRLINVGRIVGSQSISTSLFYKVWRLRIIICGVDLGFVYTLIESIFVG